VIASILPIPEEYRSSQEGKREFYNDIAYQTSDIDIFLYGLQPSEVEDKVVELYEDIKKSHPNITISASKTRETVTIFRGYPYRCIQVIIFDLLLLIVDHYQ
jgi:hypothetical protein